MYVMVVVILLYLELHGSINGESIMELVSAMVSPALVFVGLVRGRHDRLLRYRWFSLALLINIFVTQFFSFYHDQFSALPGFITNLLFYIGVRSLIKHEERLQLRRA
jgi:chromate transport protein ChrA